MAKALDDDWRGWLRLNRDRGCDLETLFRAAASENFDEEQISAELNGFKPTPKDPTAPPPKESPDDWLAWFNAPLTRSDFHPRAWRLDTPLAQIYEIPGLLTRAECATLVALTDRENVPSETTGNTPNYRTSRTCHLRRSADPIVDAIEERIARLIGVSRLYSEGIQAQRYRVGEYFKEHTDWFAPGSGEYDDHAGRGGQRTWTVMIYLSQPEAGGETRFSLVGRDFFPTVGTAVAWNNLNADGSPNRFTLHEALPVIAGTKYVITKWFRSRTGLHF